MTMNLHINFKNLVNYNQMAVNYDEKSYFNSPQIILVAKSV